MLGMNYRGPYEVRADHKPIPEILHPRDAIVRVTRSCICGSDLHLYNGSVPDTRVGMTFGHEFTGVVEELGEDVEKLKVGDHVLVPFNIACGTCVFCQQGLYGNCHESNPQATAVGGIFGYSHTARGYDGGQAEYVRVPYAEVSTPTASRARSINSPKRSSPNLPTNAASPRASRRRPPRSPAPRRDER
jgi:threonine dehydrogenase-like Zn-dependent dehydrogenase